MPDLSKIVLASQNEQKLKEFQGLLRPLNIDALPLKNFTDIEPEETGKTFEDNAILKARHAFGVTKLPSLADDSGLVVPALDNIPGVYSKRFAGPEQDYVAAARRLHDMLAEKNIEEARAALVCVLALVTAEGRHVVFEGRIDGMLVWPPRGVNKFGYDIVFMPDGMDKTFAEISRAEKNKMSHRFQAFQKFLGYLKTVSE